MVKLSTKTRAVIFMFLSFITLCCGWIVIFIGIGIWIKLIGAALVGYKLFELYSARAVLKSMFFTKNQD